MTYEEAKEQLALKKHKTTYRAFYLTEVDTSSSKYYEWYITGEDGSPVAYKEKDKAPVILDAEKAIEILIKSVQKDNNISGSTLTDVGRYKVRNNGE